LSFDVRRVQEQEFIRSLLGGVIEDVLSKSNVSLETQPMKVHCSFILLLALCTLVPAFIRIRSPL
jgi:hypothetical protein